MDVPYMIHKLKKIIRQDFCVGDNPLFVLHRQQRHPSVSVCTPSTSIMYESRKERVIFNRLCDFSYQKVTYKTTNSPPEQNICRHPESWSICGSSCVGLWQTHGLFAAYPSHPKCGDPLSSSACDSAVIRKLRGKSRGRDIKAVAAVWWQRSWWLRCHLGVISRRDRFTTLLLSFQLSASTNFLSERLFDFLLRHQIHSIF